MSFDTIGSIATHLAEMVSNLPAGVSGNLVIIVDMARQHVENYTGTAIGSNSINITFQPAIVDFAKADLVDLLLTQQGGEDIRLEGLSISETGEQMSGQQFRMLGEMKLRSLGRDFTFSKSLS